MDKSLEYSFQTNSSTLNETVRTLRGHVNILSEEINVIDEDLEKNEAMKEKYGAEHFIIPISKLKNLRKIKVKKLAAMKKRVRILGLKSEDNKALYDSVSTLSKLSLSNK